MSYYIVGNFDGSDDLTGGSAEDIYGGLISGGIVDGGYESFLGGLGVHEESSDSDTEDVDNDRESSSSESSSDSELDDEVQKPPKKALNKLLEDPDVDPEPVELNELEDEHHEQTIEDILNMDEDDEAGDLDEVNGGGKKKPVEPVADSEVHSEEDVEFGVEDSHEDSHKEDVEEIFGVEDNQESNEATNEDHSEEDIEFGIEDDQEPNDATSDATNEDQEEDPEEDIEFGVEEESQEDHQEEPDKNQKKKLERPDNLEVDNLDVDIKPTPTDESTETLTKEPTLGGSKFGDALSAYLTN